MDVPYDFYQLLNFEGPESSLRPHWSTRVYFGAKGRVLLEIARVLVFEPDKIGFSGSGSGSQTRTRLKIRFQYLVLSINWFSFDWRTNAFEASVFQDQGLVFCCIAAIFVNCFRVWIIIKHIGHVIGKIVEQKPFDRARTLLKILWV